MAKPGDNTSDGNKLAIGKLSTDSYKGVRDFYPEDMFIQKYIFDVWRKTAESFGYEEYGASVLEPTELYRAKSGDEIVNEQTYNFKDRGERDVTLRPEMTPTVARMVAAKRRELGFPLRWYSTPNLFRYEQPQRGRVREHWQLNADLFGTDSIEADVEIISLAYQTMHAFGAKDEDFEIRVNDRKARIKGLEGKDMTPEQLSRAIKLLDKKEKMSAETFADETKKILGEIIEIEFTESDTIKKILALLADRGIENARFNKHLVRGFDYYTGTTFEIFDTNPANRRSLFGGGRYDDLTSLFGGDKVTAVGFGMGDVTIRDFLETHNLLPVYKPAEHIRLCPLEEKFAENCEQLAATLRSQGINVAIDFSRRKIGDQIKSASKQHVPFITVIGDEEARSQVYKIKNLDTGVETLANEDQIASLLK